MAYDNRNMGTFTEWVMDNYAALRESIGAKWGGMGDKEIFNAFFHAYHEEFFRVMTPIAIMQLQAERDRYNAEYLKHQAENKRLEAV